MNNLISRIPVSFIWNSGFYALRILRIDEEERWIEHICQPVYSPEGKYIGRRAGSRDITYRKKAHIEREKLIAELQEALKNIRTLSGLLPICSQCKKNTG